MQTSSHKRSFDAIVVGAGVIGLSVAWEAVRQGLDVVVLERDEPASGATGVAAGMLAPAGEATFGEERLLEMLLASLRAYPAWVDELESASGVATGFRRCGAVHVALDRDEAEELRRRHALQTTLGLEAEWLAPKRCREIEPGLAPSLAGGVHAPAEAAIDPRALVGALRAALARAGAEVRTGTEVRGAFLEAERLRGVSTAAGERLLADHVVMASGCLPGSLDWLPAGSRPPLRPVKGQIVTLRGAAEERVCEGIVASERAYIVPRDDGRLLVGATVEERGFDLSVTAGGVHELLREAYRLLPEIAELELLEARAGLRPAAPDNRPLIGPGALEGLVLATGHFRNGVLLAPLTAQRVCRLLTGAGVPA